jgi:hypothetical protein
MSGAFNQYRLAPRDKKDREQRRQERKQAKADRLAQRRAQAQLADTGAQLHRAEKQERTDDPRIHGR